MFEKLMQAFGMAKSEDPILQKDAIAEMLKVNPAALDAFEAAYAKHAMSSEPEGVFQQNSRHAARDMHAIDIETINTPVEDISELVNRIVQELLAQTETYVFDGRLARTEKHMALPARTEMVDNKDINHLPAPIRPQLSGNLMKVDIAAPTAPHLLWFYDRFKNHPNPKVRQDAYHHFRQGLDILDLDALTYEIIGTNPNSMGHWLPKLVDSCMGQEFFKIPATTVAKVPLTMLQLTRQEYAELTETTLKIVDEWAHEAFKLDDQKEYFIKTGTYSSKFDFRNAHVHGAKEVRELGEYLLFIHYQALQMASPLCTPTIYGVSTTNEWVVREFIADKENNPCIYKGLPLHTEYRVFVDCDTDSIIGITPYWEPNTMKNRFAHGSDANSPHQIHDYVIYKAHEDKLMGRYHENKDRVLENIKNILPNLNLRGQWSIDIMQNGDDFWIIDMAMAETSAFYECVPQHLRMPSPENWIPQLPEA